MAINQEQSDQNFNFRRIGNNGRVVVSNNLSYTMAEYDENTGVTRWQRVVPAGQREKVQIWLLANYPVKIEPVAVRGKTRVATAA
jgi:hypothetical protein